MDNNQLTKTEIYQLHLAMKNLYTLVLSINYTKNTYSVIDSDIEVFPLCSEHTDFISVLSKYFNKCHPEDRQNYPLIGDLDALVEHLTNNKGSYTFEFRIESTPFAFNWYEGTYFLIDDAQSEDTVLLFLLKDINNKKLVEENLKDAFIANEIAAKAKTDFLSRISQDLRTPISLIVSMIDLARNNINDKEKVMDCLVKMDISSRYLFQLIDNVLDMSKLESGKFNIDNSPFNILDILEEIKSTYKSQIDSNGILFTVRHETKGIENLIGDAFRIKQALKNLISNSFKYTPVGGCVSLDVILNKVIYDRAFFSFIIKNDGPPLDESQIDRFFLPFEKGYSNNESKTFEGLGLGLSLCKNTIELLGGSIKGYNNPDETGVIFEVEVAFELDENNSPKEIDFLADDAYIRFPKRQVLVAENDTKSSEVIKALLESRDIMVDLAIDGLEAVKLFELAPPGYYDLILTDLDLPMMSGLEVAESIRNSFHENGATIPIIGMSVDVLEQNVFHALESGMNGHISKPITITNLSSTLKNYI